jgi:mono/diheme cytochrome c family protein
MKYLLLSMLLVSGMLLNNCSSTATLFDYPLAATSDTAKQRFEKEFTKGKILYRTNCAKCHTVNENGKPTIPDFSLPQLMDYEMRFQYPEHEEDLKETNITHEEMEFVIQYLRYKKKSGMPYRIGGAKKGI